jgi:hypothetical protein
VPITKGHDFGYLGRETEQRYNIQRSSFIEGIKTNMLSGATLVLTVISAVGVGVAAGWAVLGGILYAFSRRTAPKTVKA